MPQGKPPETPQGTPAEKPPISWPAEQAERRPLAALMPYARNARTHSPEQIDQIAASIREWGWTMPILIDEAGMILAGHGRALGAAKLGIAEVPVIVARGWTDEQKRAYQLADNKLALNAGWDEALLRPELIALAPDMRALVGFSAEELRAMSIGIGEAEFPDIPEGERGDFRSMSFVLHKDQAALVDAALDAAKAMGAFDGPNPNSNGNALARVCETYLEWQQQAQRKSA